MALYEIPIVQKGRILADLFANVAMPIQEAVKIRILSAVGLAILPIRVAISIGITILFVGVAVACVGIAISLASIAVARVVIAVIEFLQSHERIRPSANLLFHTWMVLQIAVQLRMALQELRVIDQRRRFAKLFGIFTMTVQELVESRQIPSCDFVIVVL